MASAGLDKAGKMINATNKPQPLVRAREVRPLLNWHLQGLLLQVQLTFDHIPDSMLTDRKALADLLAGELRTTSKTMADTLEEQWQASWERDMGGRFVDAPNVEN